MKEMEELRDDIKMHLDLDRESQINVKYWEVCLCLNIHYNITLYLNNHMNSYD